MLGKKRGIGNKVFVEPLGRVVIFLRSVGTTLLGFQGGLDLFDPKIALGVGLVKKRP
jgi:hypothetical protein